MSSVRNGLGHQVPAGGGGKADEDRTGKGKGGECRKVGLRQGEQEHLRDRYPQYR